MVLTFQKVICFYTLPFGIFVKGNGAHLERHSRLLPYALWTFECVFSPTWMRIAQSLKFLPYQSSTLCHQSVATCNLVFKALRVSPQFDNIATIAFVTSSCGFRIHRDHLKDSDAIVSTLSHPCYFSSPNLLRIACSLGPMVSHWRGLYLRPFFSKRPTSV